MNSALARRRRRPKKRGGGLTIALRFAIVGISTVLLFLLGSILAAVGAVAAVYGMYVRELPDAEEISRRSVETFETTRLYDRSGQHLLWEIFPETAGRRTWVPLSRIPLHLRNATIAMEDKTFYTNPAGINIEGLARAVRGVILNRYEGGGSSITQQLIRNVIMTPEERMERSYVRKLKEMILAYELTRRYPGVEGRDMILEWYLNNIFYGHFAFGVEAAAQTYFNKHVEELTLAEAAMLVPLGQSPARNPIDRPEEAKRYQEVVLDEMARQGYITPEEAWAAKQEPLVIAPARFDMKVPHWVLYVQDVLVERFGRQMVYGGGLQVITTIDLEKQAKAQEFAREQIAKMRDKHNVHNAAVVILDTKTAEILAMVGSLDYYDKEIDGQINMAISPRQPGSSFKPFTYATAFAQGYTPATMVMDVRTSFPDPPNPAPYVPENYSRTFHGPMLLRRALACSYNVPAVALLHQVGTVKVVETAHAMGITTLNAAHYGLSLTLGGGDVKLLDMVYAFSVFANGGTMLGVPVMPDRYRPGYRQLDPVAILKVTDASGKVIYEYTEPQRQEVIRPEVAYLITDILSDNQARTPAFGPESVLVLKDRPAAAKTGTTNDFHDGWTIGYTPQYVVGVWTGNTNYEKMKNAPGVRTAGPIWQNIMEWLHEGLPVEAFQRPPGLVTAVVDGTSGKLPTQYSGRRTQELFIEGTVPTEQDDVHRPFRICRTSGQLATAYCPAEDVETQVFEIYPPEAEDWVREQGKPQPPLEYCHVHGPNLRNAEVAIVDPVLMQTISGVKPIIGNARPSGMSRFWLEYGVGMDPQSWVRITPDYGHRVDNGVLTEWNTGGLDGLYTLRLGVQDGGGVRYASVPVLVDNAPPEVTILSPEEGKVYVMEEDEWINIQAYVVDNTAMDKVEFFLDDELLGFSTVAPYTLRWNLALNRVKPEIDLNAVQPMVQIVGDETISIDIRREPELTIYSRQVQVGDTVTVTDYIEIDKEGNYIMRFPSGREIVSDAGGYTETHAIHIVAYDQAGNKAESPKTKVQVIPKPKEEKERR
ncbi:MAG: transglycosylase domain-containing protein [Chloroflexi bacterium]|nr:transglycosylase domain-containing protein [Chloroflexota bacterium]